MSSFFSQISKKGFTQRMTKVFEHIRRGSSKTGNSFHMPKSALGRSGNKFLGGYFQSFIGFSLFDVFVYLENKIDNKERNLLFEGLQNMVGDCTVLVGNVQEDTEKNRLLLEDIGITIKRINTFLVEMSKKTDSSS